MAHCLNHKHPEIQELAQKTGLHPALVAAKAALWQEKNNNLDRFPTAKEIINSDQVTIIKDAIKSSLPIEVSNAVTVVRNVPKDVLGRDDLFLSMKNVLEEKGITNTFLINWLGINLPSNMSRKQAINSINSESQIEGLAKKSYDNLLKADHPALQNKEIRQSFNSWVKALENYPVVFKDLMLKHAIKNLNPDRRAKFVLQLSAVALQQAYGIAVNKPHELNRIGKIYDSEVLKTVSDAVGHEPSASGNGYWVHIPRTEAPKVNLYGWFDVDNYRYRPYNIDLKQYLREDKNNLHKTEYITKEQWEEAKTKYDNLPNNDAQFKVNVELLRKLSPSKWCTASSAASQYVKDFDNYLLIVDGITVAGIEAYPTEPQIPKEELLKKLDKINTRIEIGDGNYEDYNRKEELENQLNGKLPKIKVKEVTSRANNGVSSIDHFDDIYAFFEKHNLDTNNYSLQASKKAKEAGQKDSEVSESENPEWEDFEEQVEDDYAPAWDEGDDRDDPGAEFRHEEARWNNLHTVQAMETETEVLQAIEADTVPVFDYFNALPQHLKDTEAIARLAIANNSHNITHISHTVPFYIELARLSITRNPNVFHYLSTEAQAMPEFQKIHQDHIDSIEELPFSKTNNNQIQGYYDPNTDKVVVVASNTPVDEAAKVAIHEVAHRGMIRMAQDLGGTNELNKILFNAEKELMKKLPELLERTGHKNVESLVKDYGFDINTKEGKAKLLSELAARWAETLIDKPKPSWWKEFLTSIQNWIKKFTGKTLSEEEVNELVGGFVRYGAKVNKPSTKQKSQNTSKVKAEPVYFSLEELRSSNQVNYSLKAVDILISDKAKQVFEKGIKNNWPLDKILTELQVPKEQKQIILDRGHKILTHNDARLSNEPDLREQIITDLLANYSYTVEINTAKRGTIGRVIKQDIEYPNLPYTLIDGETGMPLKGFKTKEEADTYNNNLERKPSNHYSNLTVPGGTNYTENEISTPLITPSIKGHAQFSTDNGIGWFRADEQVNNGIIEDDLSDLNEGERYYAEQIAQDHLINTQRTIGGEVTKTRRILEVQSDLFQKGRDKRILVDAEDTAQKLTDFENSKVFFPNWRSMKNYEHHSFLIKEGVNKGQYHAEYSEDIGDKNHLVFFKNGTKRDNIITEDNYVKIYTEEFEKQKIKEDTVLKPLQLKVALQEKQNQFLQLLNKNNNWVTFFIKSIIQDSARKGYEKVLFPSGNTASKVEGHTTLEEFKKQKEDRIKELEKELNFHNRILNNEFNNVEEIRDELTGYVETVGKTLLNVKTQSNNRKQKIEYEINQLKQELERVETEGFGALKPIYNFYENTVTNILKKLGNVNVITDEYGNTWNELNLSEFTDKLILLNKAITQSSETKTNIQKEIFTRGIDVRYKNSEIIQKLLDAGYISEDLLDLAKSLQKIYGSTTFVSSFQDADAYMTYTDFGKNIGKINLHESPDFYTDKNQFGKSYLHEVLHHYTVGALKNPTTDEERAFKDKIESLYKEALSLYKNPKDFYGLTDAYEFVSEIMTNKDFVNDLKSRNPNILVRFINAVLKLLGLSGKEIHRQAVETITDYIVHVNNTVDNTNKLKTSTKPQTFKSVISADVKKAIDPKLEAAVDKVIDNLVQRIEELKTIAGGSTNQSTRINIARLQTKLAELSEERTYEKLADIALYQLNEASRILALDTPSAFELNEVKRILIYTENFDSYLTEGGKDFKAVKDLIREKNVTSNVIFQEKLLDAAFAQSKITGVEYSREELNKAQKDESKLAAQTLSPEYSSVNLAKIIGRAIVLANRKTQEDFSNNFIDPLAELLRALDKKKFETSDFNEVMEDGKLILEFTNEFFEHESDIWKKHYELLQDYKKDTKLGAQIKASFEDIFTWYKDNLDYYVTPETRKKYEQDLADFKKANLDANGKETAKTAEAVRKWQAVNSPYLMLKRTEDEDGNQTIESDPDGKVFIDAKIVWATQIGDKYYKNTNWHKYLKARPKKKYKNSKWEKASENPLHKFMLEKYVEAMKMLPRKVAVDTENYHRFLNEFSLDVTQSENRLKQMYSGIGNIARETFTIQVNQAMLDGGVIKKIVNPDGSITEEFQPFLRSKDEKGNTKPHIKHKTIEDLKKREKFRDPLEILQEFFKQAVTYNHRVEAAPMLDLLQYKIENLPGISTNMINAILLDAHRNPEIIENGLVNTAAQTRYAINAFKSGITRMDSDLGTIITDKQKAKLRELTEAWVAGGMQGPAPTISPISGVKVSDALVDYTRMSLIGLKPFTAATNLLLGLMSNYVYAARNKEFSEKHLDQASRLLFGNILKFISRKRILTSDTKKTANLSEKMGITDTLYETKDPDVAIQAKNKFVKFVYALQEGGEFLIANQTMIAMMLNTKITSKDGVESNLWEATNEDGNLKPEFQTKEWTSVEVIDDKGDNISKLNAFRNSLDKIRKRTQGDYQSPMAAKGEWYFRHIMMFRTWIPQALRERWGKEDEDFKGRYRSYGAMFTHSFKSAGFKGFLETAGRFALATIAKMTNILPLGKYRFDKLDNAAKESFDKYLDKIGASELDVENMRANIKELQFLLTMSIVALALTSLKGDDDDDKTLNFLINIMNRLHADLTAFVHPKSALNIIKDPIPVMKTIKDVVDVLQAGSDYIENPEGRYYKKGYNKGDLKFFEEVQDLLPIYSAINSTQGTLNTVFNSESYKYAK